jgi:hypothetical protein
MREFRPAMLLGAALAWAPLRWPRLGEQRCELADVDALMSGLLSGPSCIAPIASRPSSRLVASARERDSHRRVSPPLP